MFDFDWFREIASTIKKNKARTFLTGVAVAWGILMLIILLGAGNGLKNGVQSNFSRRAQNTVTIWPGWTSVPYKGMPAVRQIKFDNKVYNYLANHVPEVEYISAMVHQNVTLTYGEKYGTWNLNGVSPDASHIFNIQPSKGRFINEIDIKQRRKAIVINQDIAQVLFPDGDDPLGKFVTADNLTYQIVGLYEDEDGQSNPPAYIPFTTAQTLYSY
ncbi:MAG: ABC transporter permease, partial [Bacteroidaceae bacterium]